MLSIQTTDIDIVQADITTLAVDAIVNPAAPDLMMTEGVAGAIKAKGGRAIEDAAVAAGHLEPGDGRVTDAGELSARRVIHVVTVDQQRQTDEHILRRAYARALVLASLETLSSIAIPALGCGVGGLPPVASAKIMAQELLKHCRYHATTLRRVTLCCHEAETFAVFEQTVSGYVNHVQDDLGNGPYVTVDVIIEMPDGIVLIERSNPPFGWALPGGFVDVGESLETAAVREAKEETGLDLENLQQFHVYSAPDRDPRFHTVSTVFTAVGRGTPRFGSDAQGLVVVPRDALLQRDYAFDHKQVIADFLQRTASA